MADSDQELLQASGGSYFGSKMIAGIEGRPHVHEAVVSWSMKSSSLIAVLDYLAQQLKGGRACSGSWLLRVSVQHDGSDASVCG